MGWATILVTAGGAALGEVAGVGGASARYVGGMLMCVDPDGQGFQRGGPLPEPRHVAQVNSRHRLRRGPGRGLCGHPRVLLTLPARSDLPPETPHYWGFRVSPGVV